MNGRVSLSLVVLLVCSDAGAPAAFVPAVSDSAGVRMVTSAPEDLVYAGLAGTPLDLPRFHGRLAFGVDDA